MLIECPFTIALYNDLKPGDFFFNPFDDDGHNPAMKVEALNGQTWVLDLDAAQAKGSRIPTTIREDDFLGSWVVCLAEAAISATDFKTLVSGATSAGIAPIGSIVLRDDCLAIKAKASIAQPLFFSVSSGKQVDQIDSSRCAWFENWSIVVPSKKEERTTLFSR